MPHISTEVEVEFELICAGCGHDLSNDADVRHSRLKNTPQIVVAVCPQCFAKACEEARSEGYDDGYDSGKDDGHEKGYKKGYAEGLQDAEG